MTRYATSCSLIESSHRWNSKYSYLNTQYFTPYTKHTASPLSLFKAMLIYCKKRRKRLDTHCGRNVSYGSLIFKTRGKYTYHCVSKVSSAPTYLCLVYWFSGCPAQLYRPHLNAITISSLHNCYYSYITFSIVHSTLNMFESVVVLCHMFSEQTIEMLGGVGFICATRLGWSWGVGWGWGVWGWKTVCCLTM